MLGAIVALVLGEVAEPLTLVLLPIAAGGFIYVALSDLIPELHKMKSARHSIIQLAAILVGVAAMFALLEFEGEEHGHGASEPALEAEIH